MKIIVIAVISNAIDESDLSAEAMLCGFITRHTAHRKAVVQSARTLDATEEAAMKQLLDAERDMLFSDATKAARIEHREKVRDAVLSCSKPKPTL